MSANSRRRRRAADVSVLLMRRALAGLAVFLGTVSLLLLMSVVGALVGSPSQLRNAYAAPHSIAATVGGFTPLPTDTPTPMPPTPTPSPTPTPLPPALTLVSPASGKGPVGAHMTVTGANFTGTSATLFGSTQADCSNQGQTLATPQVNGDGTLTAIFLWPTSLTNGTYYLCAAGLVSGAPSYQVLASSPPTLSLSTQTIQLGQQLTINGSNFVGLPGGAQILLFEVDSSAATSTLSMAPVGDNGDFTATWTVAGATGNVTIQAASPQDGVADAALQASAALVVQPAAAETATGEPSATSTPPATFQGGQVPPPQQSDNSGLIVFLVTAMILLLILLLVAAFVVLRGRQGSGEPYGGGGYSPGAYPGYAERSQMMPRVTAKVPRVTAKVPVIGQTGRQPAVGRFGQPGEQGEWQMGRVAQWGEPDSVPGADWQPRPMSGYPPGYSGPTNPSGYPPGDPWGAVLGPHGPYDPRGGEPTNAADPPHGQAFGLPDGPGGRTNPANGNDRQ